jgi:hypothetical protein
MSATSAFLFLLRPLFLKSESIHLRTILPLNECAHTSRSAQAGLSEGEACGPWLKEYQRGSTYEPYGFLPGPELIGLPFSRAAGAVAERGLLLVGAQVDGQIRLNPSAEVRPGSDELASKVSVFFPPLFCFRGKR